MSRLLSSALSLRRDPRMLKAPPYLSFACILIGLIWLLVLPLDEYSRRTYISENALLPGQVHTYFGGSEQHVFRAYKEEVAALSGKDTHEINNNIEEILKGFGVKVGRQSYTYGAAGGAHSGENVYGILQAPRGDATEAIVLICPWKTIDGSENRVGVALALTLARYFKRWSLWSKDIVLLFPPEPKVGTQAWVDAYHDAHDPRHVSPLPLKSGALQGALAIDYPSDHHFSTLHIIYDGVNGQLPNLDLINAVGWIAGNQMGIPSFIQGQYNHQNSYQDRLKTMFRGMLSQGLGNVAGAHSSFIPYHVDAVTLQPWGMGHQDEMAMGRVIEGSFRSLNNLLEHLHQSFFFYLLMSRDRFVSIGTYLPSAMLLAANFTIMAIFLWVKSGQAPESEGDNSKEKIAALDTSNTVERDMLLPAAIVAGSHALGMIPLFIFNRLPGDVLPHAFAIFSGISIVLPLIVSHLLTSFYKPTVQQSQLTKSFSLLVLGLSLSTLATLNFSLSFIIGLLATPLSFVQPTRSQPLRWAFAALLSLIAPPTIAYTAAMTAGADVGGLLRDASFGWNVLGVYTPVAIWGVWWPAWTVGTVNVLGFAAA
ncbi:unnamed protein product [Clonostachys chloroleuca]|uniref:GPI transamidase component GAA1 n=1 Tax=Clonostachys chloroleuca TaxID=1926264 RepID=A0AA35MER1_9HYPO|nr:unnamed protein product [Clonostachys chloroleuca]